jgi:hypothetical protein
VYTGRNIQPTLRWKGYAQLLGLAYRGSKYPLTCNLQFTAYKFEAPSGWSGYRAAAIARTSAAAASDFLVDQ